MRPAPLCMSRGDMLGSVAAIAAAGIIMSHRLDGRPHPIPVRYLSPFSLASRRAQLRASPATILLEGTPEGLSRLT